MRKKSADKSSEKIIAENYKMAPNNSHAAKRTVYYPSAMLAVHSMVNIITITSMTTKEINMVNDKT